MKKHSSKLCAILAVFSSVALLSSCVSAPSSTSPSTPDTSTGSSSTPDSSVTSPSSPSTPDSSDSSTPSEPVITKRIEIETAPTKNKYVVNDKFSSAGLVVKLYTCTDGHEDEGVEFTEYDLYIDDEKIEEGHILAKNGDFNVEVRPREEGIESATFSIHVSSLSKRISIVTAPTKNKYIVNDKFSSDGLAVKLYTSIDGHEDEGVDFTEYDLYIGEEKIENGYVLKKNGDFTVEVRPREKGIESVTFSIHVSALTKRIAIVTTPDKDKYIVNEQFSSAGLEVKLYTATDGQEDEGVEFTEYDLYIGEDKIEDGHVLAKNGDFNVEVRPREEGIESVTFPIHVSTSTQRLEIKAAPSKVNYFVGDTFSTEGLQVKLVTILDGKPSGEQDCSNYSLYIGENKIENGSVLNEAGSFKVEVRLDDPNIVPVSFSIKVSTLSKKLVIASPASKLNYFVGDTLSTEGLQVKLVKVIDGRPDEGEVCSDYSLYINGEKVQNGTPLNEAGTFTVDVKVADSKVTPTSFSIKVSTISKKLAISTPATKLNYATGEKFSAEGLQVKLITTIDGEDDEGVAFKDYKLYIGKQEITNEYIFSDSGTFQVDVKANDASAKIASTSFNVTVKESVSIDVTIKAGDKLNFDTKNIEGGRFNDPKNPSATDDLTIEINFKVVGKPTTWTEAKVSTKALSKTGSDNAVTLNYVKLPEEVTLPQSEFHVVSTTGEGYKTETTYSYELNFSWGSVFNFKNPNEYYTLDEAGKKISDQDAFDTIQKAMKAIDNTDFEYAVEIRLA